MLQDRGADALRWNFVSASSPWMPKRVSLESIDETTNRFLLTLWNTYSFFVTYANLDGWTPERAAPSASRATCSTAGSAPGCTRTVAEVDDALEAFDALRGRAGARALVDDLSNWYVRRSRSRFWNARRPRRARGAARVPAARSRRCSRRSARSSSDALYQDLAQTDESVHLSDWPVVDDAAIDRDARGRHGARAPGRVARARGAHRGRGSRCASRCPRAGAAARARRRSPSRSQAEIADALNVKQLETVTSLEGLLDYSVVPNFRRLGPKVGKLMPKVKAAARRRPTARPCARRSRPTAGTTSTSTAPTIRLEPDDVEVRATSHEEFALAEDGGIAVALDTRVDHDLHSKASPVR